VQFVLGLTQMNQMELVTHLVKIGVVMALISPGSWTFFNTYLFDAFINGSTDLIIMATGNECGNQKNPLNFLDKILNFLFEPATFIKIIALLFSSPFGVLYIYMLLNGIYRLFEAILNALFVYFAAFFYIALLISLAPIFITFILFEFTNSFFENWLRNLFRACFEPVLLIVGLAILANVLVIVINNIFDFAACFKCMLPIFIDIGDGKTLPLFCIYGFTPAGYDNSGSGIMPTIFYQFNQIMLFYIITHIMKSYADVAMQISETIFSSRAVGAARTGAAASGSFNQGMLSLIGRDKKTLAKQSNIKALGAAYEESGKETKPLEELKDADDKFKKDQSPTDKDSSDKPESNK
jgi:type IV secretion system protein VirB6